MAATGGIPRIRASIRTVRNLRNGARTTVTVVVAPPATQVNKKSRCGSGTAERAVLPAARVAMPDLLEELRPELPLPDDFVRKGVRRLVW